MTIQLMLWKLWRNKNNLADPWGSTDHTLRTTGLEDVGKGQVLHSLWQLTKRINISIKYRECWLQNLFLLCGNKMPTRCNRGFYCRSYCLLNMLRAPLCPSSGAQEYYTVVAACGISCCGFQVTLSSTPDQQLENHSTKYHRQQPLYNNLELLMMGIVVPKACCASNKICNKNLCCI